MDLAVDVLIFESLALPGDSWVDGRGLFAVAADAAAWVVLADKEIFFSEGFVGEVMGDGVCFLVFHGLA